MMCKKCYGQWLWLYEHQWSYMIAMNTNHIWSVSYQGILCMISDNGWLFKWSCMISGDRCYEILLIIDDQYWFLHHIMHDQWWSCYDITADHRWSVLIGASYHDPYLWAIWNIVWWRKKQGNVLCCTWGRPLSLQLTCTALAFLQLCKYRLSRKLWNTPPPC